MNRFAISLVVAALAAAPAHAATGDVSTLAGTGAAAFGGDGGPAGAAALHQPKDAEWLPDGSVLVADTRNHRVRRIWPSGIVATVAGTGVAGFSGDGGAATSARLSSPSDVEPTADGGFLIADPGNRRVRKVTAAGTISTVAGNGSPGAGGNGGPATSATLDEPVALSLTPDGGFLIADAGSDRVRLVSAAGTIATVAGSGGGDDDDDDEGGGGSGDGGPATLAQLRSPSGVAAAPGGGFLVSELGGHRVRLVSPAGTIARVAGTGTQGFSGDGGAATAARLNQPAGLSVTPDGGFLVADSRNARVRRVGPDGTIATVAGGGAPGFAGDDGPATLARFNLPYAATPGPGGALLIADSGNNRVRLVEGAPTAGVVPPPEAGAPPAGLRPKVVLTAPSLIRVGVNGIFSLRIACPATSPEACRGTLRLRLKPRARPLAAAAGTDRRRARKRARSRVLASGRFAVAPGREAVVKLRLSRPARRLLRKRGTLSVRAVAARRGGPNIGDDDADSVALKLRAKRKRGRRS